MTETLYFHQNNAQAHKPFCSVLIPTRGRPEAVLKAIASVRQSASPDEVDIWLRLDRDDNISLNALPKLLDEAHVVMGHRRGGYYNLNIFYTELADHSNAPYVWLFNDDCTIKGDWIGELRFWIDDHAKRKEHVKFEPGIYQVGKSEYTNHTPTTCPIIPNGCWRQFGLDTVPAVTDVQTHELLTFNGYQTVFLPKLRLIHERYPDEVYRNHRRLR